MSESTRKHRAEAPKKLSFGIVVVSTSRYGMLKNCGGTGVASSDVTIEAVSPFMEKALPGVWRTF
jgi:molybdopterin biosynthesis enzyme MoaB